MNETKPWYLSRTIWAAIVTVLTAGAGLLRLPVDGVDNGALVDAVLQAVTAIAGVVALLGRLDARERIG